MRRVASAIGEAPTVLSAEYRKLVITRADNVWGEQRPTYDPHSYESGSRPRVKESQATMSFLATRSYADQE